ncbi:MAG: apolipoprotein N-acyltransferase [Lautropia sp.]|nr:apolipoprotein N-acyltransferase [Lautropia sp.]
MPDSHADSHALARASRAASPPATVPPPNAASPRRWPALLALLLGLAHAFCFAPWGNGWLQLAVFGGFATLLAHQCQRGASLRRLGLLGALFGLGWFTAGVSWLFVAMHDIGGLPAPVAGLALLLFAAYLAIFPALASMLTGHLAKPNRPTAFMLTMTGAFTLGELARGWLLTGFPWLGFGYAHIDSPLAALAPVGGVYLVTMAVSFISAGIALSFQRLRPWLILPALGLIAVADSLEGMQWTYPHGKPISVSLLQGNVPQVMKFDPVASAKARQDYLAMIESSPADLVLLPETAWTVPWERTDPATQARLYEFILRTDSSVALGSPRVVQLPEPPADDPYQGMRFANSMVMLDRTSLADGQLPLAYDKAHLVPFGEFIPPGFRWFVDMMKIPLGDLYRGPADQAALPLKDQAIGFNICYEDIFGEELLPAVRGSSGNGQNGATILANLTNLGWYGKSHALPQHRQIARMRALETGRPMIRATNNGVTAIILPNGEVAAELPSHQSGVLKASVQGHGGLTPYAEAGGNWPVALAAALMLLLGGRLGRRTKGKG